MIKVIGSNRFTRLYEVTLLDGILASERAMDKIMELMQHKFKCMSLKADN